MSTTFDLDDVTPATTPLKESPCQEAISQFLGTPIESWSKHQTMLLAQLRAHPLIEALHNAFEQHRPIILSPDIVWLTLAQGFAHHINANPEKYRHQLVQHEGKLTLVVNRDFFVKGFSDNDWAAVLAEFSEAIRAHIGEEMHGLIVADFSTTGPVERAASEVVLLDSMQAFFSYEVHTICGIPSITLEGSAEDWQKIRDRIAKLRSFDLGWWIKSLHPILRQFTEAAKGRIRHRFWSSIYKWHGPGGSGSPHVSGWILNLFPYLNNPGLQFPQFYKREGPIPPLIKNPWLSGKPSARGPGRDDFPALPAKAPFLWNYLGANIKMEFIGGLIGISQNPESLALRPEIGWAIREAPQ